MIRRRQSDRSTGARCFLITPIGAPRSPERSRSDDVYARLFKPVLDETGLTTIRPMDVALPGIISTQLIRILSDAELAIADLSASDPNVFYEMALRHALRKPTLQVIQEGETVPFDVAALHTVEYNREDETSLVRARDMLFRQIESVFSEPKDFETPVEAALRRFADSPHIGLSEFMSRLGELRPHATRLGSAVLGEIDRVVQGLGTDADLKQSRDDLRILVEVMRSLFFSNLREP